MRLHRKRGLIHAYPGMFWNNGDQQLPTEAEVVRETGLERETQSIFCGESCYAYRPPLAQTFIPTKRHEENIFSALLTLLSAFALASPRGARIYRNARLIAFFFQL